MADEASDLLNRDARVGHQRDEAVPKLARCPFCRVEAETGLSPFLLECAKQGKTGRFQVLSIDRVQPPPDVAERLGVSAKTKSVLRRENVFYADDDPVNRVTTYVPWSIARGTGLLQDEVPHQFGIIAPDAPEAPEAMNMSQRTDRNAAHCPGRSLQPQRCFASRCAGRACGAPLTPETSTGPAGLTAGARPKARPDRRAANH